MIYDITKELFSAEVYPGDPVPSAEQIMGFDKPEPDVCQLTLLSLGTHTGTHIDAPRHFIPGGRDTEQLSLERFFGPCTVAEANGEITAEKAEELLSGGAERLLIKGHIIITPEAAQVFVRHGLLTIGTEEMTVGTKETGPQVHRILLGAETAIIESLVLKDVPEGEYLLSALPLKMSGLDGSPVRAVLICES